MDKFLMTTPLEAEYFTAVRLAVGGLCALAGFDVDETEDFKVGVTESLLILRRNGYTTATVALSLGEGLSCRISGEALGGEKQDSMEDEISRALLSALVNEVEFVANEERVTEIVFEG